MRLVTPNEDRSVLFKHLQSFFMLLLDICRENVLTPQAAAATMKSRAENGCHTADRL